MNDSIALEVILKMDSVGNDWGEVSTHLHTSRYRYSGLSYSQNERSPLCSSLSSLLPLQRAPVPRPLRHVQQGKKDMKSMDTSVRGSMPLLRSSNSVVHRVQRREENSLQTERNNTVDTRKATCALHKRLDESALGRHPYKAFLCPCKPKYIFFQFSQKFS